MTGTIIAKSRRFLEQVFPPKIPEANADAAGLPAEQVGRIEQLVEGAVQEGRMAGAVLLISRDGKLASYRAMGWLDREAHTPMRLDALFYVLSMTKAVTCATLLSLVDEGKVSLDDPLERWLPEFKGISFADGRKPEQQPQLQHCMAHTAGLMDFFPETFLKTSFTLAEFVSLGARNPLSYEPGGGWAYCNLGFCAVGRVIEIVLGVSYWQAVQDRIFRPIQMRNSFFQVPPTDRGRVAALYALTDGKLTRDDVDPFQNLPDYAAPENGLQTTALDFWRFYEMIRNGGIANGRRVLSKTSASAMAAVQTGNRNAGFLPGMGYGYGLSLVTEPTGMFRNHSVGTFGHGSYYQAHAWVDPVKKISGLLFSHNRSDAVVVTLEIEQFLPLLGALK